MANATNTWATAADVLSVTGQTVTNQQVTQAGSVVDLFTGRPYSFSWTDPNTAQVITFNWYQKVGGLDSYYLMLTVVYETVWIQQQPDLFTRLDLEAIQTMRAPIKLQHDTGLSLGPLARRALGRVSWLRTRSLHVRSPFEDLFGATGVNFGENIFPWSTVAGVGGAPSGDDDF